MKICKNILIIALLFSFAILSARSIFMESLATTAALKMGQENFIINKKYEEGLLAKGESAYKSFNFYKGIEYAIAVGAGERIEELSVYLYDENYNLVKETKVQSKNTNFPTFTIKPDYSGSYYLKITVDKGSKSDNEWMIIYGFKN